MVNELYEALSYYLYVLNSHRERESGYKPSSRPVLRIHNLMSLSRRSSSQLLRTLLFQRSSRPKRGIEKVEKKRRITYGRFWARGGGGSRRRARVDAYKRLQRLSRWEQENWRIGRNESGPAIGARKILEAKSKNREGCERLDNIRPIFDCRVVRTG